MITAQMAVVALASLVSIGALWCLYWTAYRDYRVDRLRQDLFALRDDLFDRTEAGLIAFDSPAYGVLRTTLNGSIRFAHRLSITRIAVLMFVMRNHRTAMGRQSFSVRWKHASQGLPQATRDELQTYIDKMHSLLLTHLLFSSPLFAIAILTIVLPVVMQAPRKDFCLLRDVLLLPGHDPTAKAGGIRR